jgi:anti-sigma factor RsiW
MSTITHPFTPEEIMAFVDGELSSDRTQSLSAHFDQCANCREIAESIRSISQKLAPWRVEAPQSLNEGISLSAPKGIQHAGKLEEGISRLRDILSRRWVWVPALTLVLAIVVFVAVIPDLFVMHKPATASKAVMLQRVESLEVRPYGGPRAEVGRGGGGGLDKPEARSKTIPDASKYLAAPMIARTVALSIVVKDFDAARASLEAILARHNGYAAELNVATPQGNAHTIQASLRIPAPQLVAAVAELKALGRVENETQNGEEVTQQHADLLARLKNSRETEQRLQDVLRTRTGKVKDILEVEEEIARVRGEIEQMEAEQQTLEHRVNFATIDLRLAEEYKAQLSSPAPSVGMQLRNATVNGFRNASETLLGIILFFAESGPTLLLWLLILSLPAWLLWRRYQRSLAMSSSSVG